MVSKKHRIRKDTDISKILSDINHMWTDAQNGITDRNANIIYANFRE